jgi:hypothetical protein
LIRQFLIPRKREPIGFLIRQFVIPAKAGIQRRSSLQLRRREKISRVWMTISRCQTVPPAGDCFDDTGFPLSRE